MNRIDAFMTTGISNHQNARVFYLKAKGFRSQSIEVDGRFWFVPVQFFRKSTVVNYLLIYINVLVVIFCNINDEVCILLTVRSIIIVW